MRRIHVSGLGLNKKPQLSGLPFGYVLYMQVNLTTIIPHRRVLEVSKSAKLIGYSSIHL